MTRNMRNVRKGIADEGNRSQTKPDVKKIKGEINRQITRKTIRKRSDLAVGLTIFMLLS